jgi:hypothetical protein
MGSSQSKRHTPAAVPVAPPPVGDRFATPGTEYRRQKEEKAARRRRESEVRSTATGLTTGWAARVRDGRGGGRECRRAPAAHGDELEHG